MSPIAKCVAATGGDLPAAVLLYRITYWHPKMRVQRGDFRWIVKSREEWCDDTGLTFNQYKRALAFLREAGLVDVERHLFKSKITAHIRLTQKGVDWSTWTPTDWCKSAPINWSSGEPIYMHGDTNIEIQHGVLASSASHEEDESLKEEGTGEKAMPTVAEYLAGKDKKPTKVKEGTASSLIPVWGKHAGYYVGTMTNKRRGQLSMIAKALPEGQAEVIVTKVLDEWGLFAAMVKSAAGLSVVPAQPSIDFLLKHVAFAVEFTKEQKSPVGVMTKAQSVQLTAHASKHQAATPSEVAAILAEDDEE